MSAGLLNVARRFVNLWKMSPKIRKLAVRIPIAAILILIGWLVFDELHRVPPPSPPVPNPNGYDDLVKAGQMITGNFGNIEKFGETELRALLTTNAKAMTLGRLGLTRECRVPIQYSATYSEGHIVDIVAMRRFAQALCGEGKLAEMENRPSDAFKSYLDCVRLGNQSARGGLLIDKMIDLAIEGIGLNAINKMTNQISLPDCRNAIQTLETLEANTESADDILKRDKIWSRQTYSWVAYSRMMIGRMVQDKTLNPTRPPPNWKNMIQSKENARRKLLVDIAARAFELEKGERPKTINDLVPDYLKTIPLDPFTGTNMVYQP